MTGVPALLVLALLVTLAVPVPIPAQGNLGFLNDAPVGRFNAEDWDLFRSTVREVLDAGAPMERAWKNDKNGHHGSVRSLRSFQAPDGRECKRLQIDIFADGRDGSSRYNVCRAADGSWKEDSSVTAPAPQRAEESIGKELRG